MNYQIMHEGMGYPVGAVVSAEVFGGKVRDHLKIGSIRTTTASPTIVSAVATAPSDDSLAVEHLKRALFEIEGKLASETKRADDLQLELAVKTAKLEELEYKGLESADAMQALQDKYQQLLAERRGV